MRNTKCHLLGGPLSGQTINPEFNLDIDQAFSLRIKIAYCNMVLQSYLVSNFYGPKYFESNVDIPVIVEYIYYTYDGEVCLEGHPCFVYDEAGGGDEDDGHYISIDTGDLS